jgi:hypothetical protein
VHRQTGAMITVELKAYIGWGPTERDDVASVIMYQERLNSNARICKDGSLDTIRYCIIYVLQLLALASSLPAPGMSLILAGR